MSEPLKKLRQEDEASVALSRQIVNGRYPDCVEARAWVMRDGKITSGTVAELLVQTEPYLLKSDGASALAVRLAESLHEQVQRVRALEAERDESIKNHADDMRHHARRFQAAEAERDALQQQLREVQTFDRDALELIREGVNRMPAFGVWKRELQARVLAKVVDALRDQPPAGQEAK